MSNGYQETDLARKLAEADQGIKKVHGESLYGPFYNPPAPLGEQDPKYLGLIQKIQVTQEQQQLDIMNIQLDIMNINSKVGNLDQELELTKTEIIKLSELYPIVKSQEQELNLVKENMAKSLSIKNPDFLLSLIGFFSGSLLLISGIITNIVYYAIAGMACLLLGIIHFGSIEKQN